MLLFQDSSRTSLLPVSPTSASLSRRSRRLIIPSPRLCRIGALSIALVTTACLSGICLAIVLSVFGGPPPYSRFSPFPHHRPPHPPPAPTLLVEKAQPSLIPPTPRPPKHDDHHLELDEIRDLVAKTKGYLVRDYSLGLGWNNVRYIIEAAVYHAQLMNRTLVIPSFVYGRSCEYDIAVCADYGLMVNRGDAIGWDDWRELPLEQQMAWRIPITTMFNLTHLRRTHPVIMISDYLRLHNLSTDMEYSNGRWLQDEYHRHANVFESDPQKKPSLQIIQNSWYDPPGTNRVDVLPPDMRARGNWSKELGDHTQGQMGGWGTNALTMASRVLLAATPVDKSVLPWEEARAALQAAMSAPTHERDVEGNSTSEGEVTSSATMGLRWDVTTDEQLENVLRSNGWEVLYTYNGALGMDYVKHVAVPIREVAPRQTLRGLKEDYADMTADVVLLAGEIHLYRKPGGLRFTSPQSRDVFSRLVLQKFQHTDKVLDLAKRLDERMLALNGGRMWMASHMRRGDFVRVHWAMEVTIESHLDRVKERLSHGRHVLSTLRELDMKPYEVPDVIVDRNILRLHPPLPDDKFYIATDERDPGNLTYLANNGVVLIHDLLKVEDRRQFGWPLLFTDVLGLVEQATMARAAYFYAHAMSSVAGGAINIRAARGADPRMALID